MATKHTPTPWTASDVDTDRGSEYGIVAERRDADTYSHDDRTRIVATFGLVGDLQARADRDQTIRAVNAHGEALVTALKVAGRELYRVCAYSVDNREIIAKEMLVSAIAITTGESEEDVEQAILKAIGIYEGGIDVDDAARGEG